MPPDSRKAPRRWSEAEDQILNSEAQKQYGDTAIDWSRIASQLPGRTNKDCRKRWVNHTCGSLKKGAWSESEDERLLESVEIYGQRWSLIAKDVGFRSPDQCAKRWQYSLDPRLEHKKWTTEEDNLLLNLVERHGREWKLIQEENYPGRSRNELKNRYTIITRAQSAPRNEVTGNADESSLWGEACSPEAFGAAQENMDRMEGDNSSNLPWACNDDSTPIAGAADDWSRFLNNLSSANPQEEKPPPAFSSTALNPSSSLLSHHYYAETLHNTAIAEQVVTGPDMLYQVEGGDDIDMISSPSGAMDHALIQHAAQPPNQSSSLISPYDMFMPGLVADVGENAGGENASGQNAGGENAGGQNAGGENAVGATAECISLDHYGQLAEIDALCQQVLSGGGEGTTIATSGKERVYPKVTLEIDICDQGLLDQLLHLTKLSQTKIKITIQG